IKKIRFEGRGIIEAAELNADSSKNAQRNGPGFSLGFNDGLGKGRYDGRRDGEYEGSKVTYPAAFARGSAEGTGRADLEAHYDLNGRLLTIEDQYAMGFEAFNRGDYSKALFRFNLSLVEEPVNGQFRNKAFWYAGMTMMSMKEYDKALSIFIIYSINFPETLKEETVLNIASLLLEVKTGGVLGIGSTRYYDKAKNMFMWWVESYPNSKRLPEVYFKLGECYEKMKDTNNAVLIYKKIVDSYPNTTLAEDSKKRIKAISSWWPWD
ncbi:MAG TPA: tetratricopeptide repeat protein, partial [Candidatus Wallbacteria bacterium]|nr:tetratricopeptide repeat protein [Candidatus Wallbacteria bacterium]